LAEYLGWDGRYLSPRRPLISAIERVAPLLGTPSDF